MPSHVLQYSEVVVRATFRDDGVPPLRVFVLTNVARDVMAGDDLLGRKDMNCQPRMSMFSCTIPIQLFPK